jgi:hypothetical protein
MKLNKRLKHNYDHCLNCELPLVESDNFCGSCGQKRMTGRISFGQLVIQFFEDTINWDARLFRSLRDLFVPGKMTMEYFKGHHVPYWQPLRLFLFLAAIQMLVVNVSFNKVNEKVQKANESIKRSVYEYLLLRQLDTLKTDIVKDFSNKKVATAAIDTLLVAYVHPERFRQNKLSSAMLRMKKDSVRAAIIAEILKDGEKLDSLEIDQEVEDFATGLKEGLTKGEDKFVVNMQSDSIKIPFARVKENLLPKINFDTVKTKRKTAGATIYEEKDDKNNLPSMAISKVDFINLSADQIIEKYELDGFWNKVVAKQTIKAMKDGKSGIDFFLSRLSWMLIIMMPIFALFLELVNRPYYYIEHVIFSFHCHAFLFLVVSILFFVNHNLIPTDWVRFRGVSSAVVMIYLLYYFYKAMRNVYQQGRLKTGLKYAFLLGSYFFTMLFAVFFTFIISFVFF